MSQGLSALQWTLLTGTVLIANAAAFWFISRNFFNGNAATRSEGTESNKNKNKNGILDEEEWNEFELIEKQVVTHNSAIYRFKLPTSESVLPLPIGQVIIIIIIRSIIIIFISIIFVF